MELFDSACGCDVVVDKLENGVRVVGLMTFSSRVVWPGFGGVVIGLLSYLKVSSLSSPWDKVVLFCLCP